MIWPLNFLALVVVGVLLARADSVRAVAVAVVRAGAVLAVLTVSVVLALGRACLFSVPHALSASALSLATSVALTWVVLVLDSQVIGGRG